MARAVWSWMVEANQSGSSFIQIKLLEMTRAKRVKFVSSCRYTTQQPDVGNKLKPAQKRMYFVNKPTQQPSRHHVREAAPPLEHTLKGPRSISPTSSSDSHG
ncbi:unnamed protein product [Prunus armeniaca]|uniref:Uncharacterized protein n=1 Tax=Prunus armeniaca TaxID=36596 RepID=A0A6J5VXF0_PRUAR|nr:unnamed protein product [Prunus armeniaca]